MTKKRISAISIVLLIAFVVPCISSAFKPDPLPANGLKAEQKKAKSGYNYTVFYKNNLRLDVSLKRPDKNDKNILLCIPGAYTDLQDYTVDGLYIDNGTVYNKNKVNHNLTMLMLVVKEVFPKMTIGPESFGDKIATAFGVENDIKFESAEFSRAFCVRSEDKRFAYDVCNAQMIDYLLANRDLHIEIQGPVILLAFSQVMPVGQIEFNLQRLVEIRTLMPNYLFTQS